MNLKTIFNRGWLFALLALLPLSTFAQEILVVDLRALMDSHPKKEAITAEIQSDMKEADEALSGMRKEVEDLLKKAQEAQKLAQSPIHTDDAKANYEKEAQEAAKQFQEKAREFETKGNQMRQTFANRENEAAKSLLAEISRVASKVAEEKGASLLLDKSGITQAFPSVVFANDKLDITEEVKAALQKKS